MRPPPPRSTLFPYTTLFRSKKNMALYSNKLFVGTTDIHVVALDVKTGIVIWEDRKSTRLNSSHRCISYAVFCLKKKKKTQKRNNVTLKSVTCNIARESEYIT